VLALVLVLVLVISVSVSVSVTCLSMRSCGSKLSQYAFSIVSVSVSVDAMMMIDHCLMLTSNADTLIYSCIATFSF